MSGTALVTINENQWSVEVANTPTELTTGLAGVASINPGTGMLFILPARQLVTITTEEMLFPMDIIFIKDNVVLSIAPNIEPGFLVEEATPIDMFLEVNANEAALVEVGDAISIEVLTTNGFDWSTIISFAMPLVAIGFIAVIVGGIIGKGLAGSSHSNPVRRLGKPRTEEERAKVHEEYYGTKELPPRGTGLTERGESEEGRQSGNPKSEKEREEEHYTKYGTKELPVRGSGLSSEYYWEIFDIDTGEIIQKGKPYSHVGLATSAAKQYQRSRPGKDKENQVVINIFDNVNMEEWGKTIKPVYQIGMRRGIPIEIGKTPMQKKALDRLWPYGIMEIHSDGDLTVFSAGKKYVVTTEGGVFKKEDIIPAGGHMIEIPIEKVPTMYKSKKETLYLHDVYDTEEQAGLEADWIGSTESVSVAVQKISNKWVVYKGIKEQHSIHGEPPFTKGRTIVIKSKATYGWRAWVTVEKDDPEHNQVWVKEITQAIKYEDVEKEEEHSIHGEWIYAKVGSTEMRGRKSPTGIDFEQVSPSYDPSDLDKAVEIITEKIKGEHHSISGEPRRRLVEEYGSWAVGRAEAVCSEDDIPCVTKEAKRLIETLRGRYGEEAMKYVTIKDVGKTVFHSGDVVSIVALEKENKRVRGLGEREATYVA